MRIGNINYMLDLCIKAGITPHLVGHRGIGKTESVHDYGQWKSQQLGEPFNVIEFRLGDMNDAGDILGLPDFKINPTTKEKIATKFLPPEKLPRSGKGIIFLDEINRANKEILQVIFGMLYGGKVGDWVMPDGYSVVVASNPNTPEYIVLDFQDSAYMNRMCHIKVEHNVGDWIEWANSKNIHPALTSFIAQDGNRLMPELTDFEVYEDIEPSGRAYQFLDKMINVYEKDLKENNFPEEVMKECFKGLIGAGLGVQLFKHYKNGQYNMVNIEKILNNFDQVSNYLKVLKDKHDIGSFHIFNEQLVNYLEKNDLKKTTSSNLIKYLKLMGKEWSFAFFAETIPKHSAKFTPTNKKGILKISELF